MRERGIGAGGFSLIEVIIAMFLLGIIAIAILPVMWNGITFSSQQANTATALGMAITKLPDPKKDRDNGGRPVANMWWTQTPKPRIMVVMVDNATPV